MREEKNTAGSPSSGGDSVGLAEAMEIRRPWVSSFWPDNQVLAAILKPVLPALSAIKLGKAIHGHIVKLACNDAHAVFTSINHKDVLWNAIVTGFAENKFIIDAFKMLKGPTEPNYSTIANILPVCASLDKNVLYCFGREIRCYVQQRTELLADVSVFNALVSFYLRVGWMD
ncbi:hypothetical protein SO802_021539 [Lithocarpus litseifolius]|uniref:Uncharacterized protein n=1 Tax=Lithocarpus litseifolius TaxID=425828 RepID=A0AAW2CGK7_9ROSI